MYRSLRTEGVCGAGVPFEELRDFMQIKFSSFGRELMESESNVKRGLMGPLTIFA